MDDKKDCKISACCKTHWCTVFGMILVVLATILTFITLSGLGIFGMFLAGLMLCCHKNLSSRGCCGCCGCGPSAEQVVCDMISTDKVKKVSAKKAV